MNTPQLKRTLIILATGLALFGTGAANAQMVPTNKHLATEKKLGSAEVLGEAEITTSNLEQLFKNAFFGATVADEDGYLMIETDGPLVMVSVEPGKKLLKFMTIYGVKKSSSLEMKHALINKMNDEIILGRFSIPESHPDVLVADYYLPYENGIPAYQIVSALRLFSKVVPGAIRNCDDDDLVE